MANNSKAKHILYGTLYVVQMYRWGNKEGHNYTAGIFDNETDAKACGVAENIWRGSKYEPTIYQHNINEWRNGSYSAMYKEIKDLYTNVDINELYESKKCWEDRLEETDKEAYIEYKTNEMVKKTEEAKILREHWASKDKDEK